MRHYYGNSYFQQGEISHVVKRGFYVIFYFIVLCNLISVFLKKFFCPKCSIKILRESKILSVANYFTVINSLSSMFLYLNVD